MSRRKPNAGSPFCSGPMTRRSWLSAGAMGVAGMGLSDLLALRAQAAEASSEAAARSDTAVIFLWLPGGPPHMETYDMKPDAPADYRGEFRPIHTNVPGIDVCELLPLHAKIADKYTLIRSCAHEFSDHGGGHKRFMTGRDPLQPTGFVNDYPAVGSMIARMREGQGDGGLPSYVLGVDGGRQGIDTFSLGTAYLGQAYAPFTVPGDPSDPKFQVQNLSLAKEMENRLTDRTTLLSSLDRMQRNVDAAGDLSAMDKFSQQALQLLTSDKARKAFDLSLEDEKTRERYGKHAWGMRALMARRLVEAGCSFVTMVLENPYVSGVSFLKNGTYNWDSHAVNCHLFDDARVRFPIYDQVVTALIEDLYARGLDKRVLLVVTGEFGRTPRLSQSVGSQTGVMQPGRDHWPGAMSMLVSGGGMRTGQVVGSTNDKGEHPVDRPLSPNDLWATVMRHLGINWEATIPDHSGRPMPLLPFGTPIAELV
ncbi:protein of unknown function DUF1501 [Pirellula staleyi DSM 6068]|uniref:DUF1501 domain-containing protein n=1 Tax=Pirellula staleyi (strain ATCC 27377 / DSM 6068 / ICPB 4128) TaxID=530564 RepID=D2R2D0_PIRSD|nr:DUF1501 domain-containing protein [Pirellula staleyi]ADB15039.1 protein of unknown function DUF1501 [Pirellula staleyi DSM 6068]